MSSIWWSKTNGEEDGKELAAPLWLPALHLAAPSWRPASSCAPRARFPRLDCFGRKWVEPCCAGNVFAVQGHSPMGGPAEEHARAMGIDAGHMPFRQLAKALPPAYISYAVGQMAMH